jgi:hypothetical protein
VEEERVRKVVEQQRVLPLQVARVERDTNLDAPPLCFGDGP